MATATPLTFAATMATIVALVAGAASFPLEWNVTYRTDVPYEVDTRALLPRAISGEISQSLAAVVPFVL